MNLQLTSHAQPTPNDLLCVVCKSFYGSEVTQKMCSQCFKKHQAQNQTVTPSAPIQDQQQKKQKEQQKKVDKSKCGTCSKKLKLMGIECRCGLFFCSTHRLPQDHKCTFNHRELAKKQLTEKIIKVKNGKIQTL